MGGHGRKARDFPRRRGIAVIVPQLSTEKRPRLADRDLCRERDVAERLVGRLEEYPRVATHHDMSAAGYPALVQPAAIRLWL